MLLSVVIPLFNEQENVEPLLAEVDDARGALPCELEVIAVDDGSGDATWAKVTALTARYPWLRAIRLLTRRGQTAAMAAGIAASRGELIGFLDGDLQNDPHDLPKLVAPVLANEADVVCGWRAQRRDSATRTLPSMIANFVIRRSLNVRIHDVGCTLKVFRRPYIEDVALVGEMHRFLPSYAQAQGARIAEVEVHHRPRHAGASKYGFERVGKVLVDLLTVKLLNQYGASPAYLFGKIALALFFLGSVAFTVVAYRVLVLERYEATPMLFIMTLLYTASLLSLMSGLLAELNIRVLHRAGGQTGYKVVERIGFGDE